MIKLDSTKLKNYFKSKDFFDIKKKVLIAVSGGVDSMTLLHLMQQTDYQISVAHVDHLTRNGKSSKDALFIEKYCNKHDIIFHKTEYVDHMPLNGNFHNKAHKFRYEYFRSLKYDFILTAHHYEDNIETIVLNFLAGKSTSGIPEINKDVIRPLLSYHKVQILEYANTQKVPFVEDETNNEEAYDRNFIRNTIMPLLQSRDKNIKRKINALSNAQHQDGQLLSELVSSKLKFEYSSDSTLISKKNINLNHLLLYHSIKSYGFNRSQAKDIIGALDKVGSLFYSKTYILLIDRAHCIIKLRNHQGKNSLTIKMSEVPITVQYLDYSIDFGYVNKVTEISKNILYCPIDKLKSELTLRTWRHGDIFMPYGMSGKKKTLKKFFADSKINRFQKEEIPLLLSEDKIIWVCGQRSDHRFRYSNLATKLLKVTLSF